MAPTKRSAKATQSVRAPDDGEITPKKRARASSKLVKELTAVLEEVPAVPWFRNEDDIRAAVEHVLAGDPLLAPLIEEHGHPVKLLKQQGMSPFQSLAKTIIYQQLHGKAAEAIHGRFLALCEAPLTPAGVLAASVSDMRACGLSERKVEYLTCLAQRFDGDQLGEEHITAMPDHELKELLMQVKGIGPWSVDMLLMSNLGRVNVLPVGDLAVRKGMQALYGLPAPPSAAQMEELARKWEPYRSIGTYMMWRVPTVRSPTKAKAVKVAAKAKILK